MKKIQINNFHTVYFHLVTNNLNVVKVFQVKSWYIFSRLSIFQIYHHMPELSSNTWMLNTLCRGKWLDKPYIGMHTGSIYTCTCCLAHQIWCQQHVGGGVSKVAWTHSISQLFCQCWSNTNCLQTLHRPKVGKPCIIATCRKTSSTLQGTLHTINIVFWICVTLPRLQDNWDFSNCLPLIICHIKWT